MSIYKSAYEKCKRFTTSKNGYEIIITMTLHNGSMNHKGFVSVTMSEFNTHLSSDFAKSYTICELLEKITNQKYNFNKERLIRTFLNLGGKL